VNKNIFVSGGKGPGWKVRFSKKIPMARRWVAVVLLIPGRGKRKEKGGHIVGC